VHLLNIVINTEKRSITIKVVYVNSCKGQEEEEEEEMYPQKVRVLNVT